MWWINDGVKHVKLWFHYFAVNTCQCRNIAFAPGGGRPKTMTLQLSLWRDNHRIKRRDNDFTSMHTCRFRFENMLVSALLIVRSFMRNFGRNYAPAKMGNWRTGKNLHQKMKKGEKKWRNFRLTETARNVRMRSSNSVCASAASLLP